MTRILVLAALLFPSAIRAQPVVITGTLTGPGRDKLNGYCTYAATATFTASDGSQVATATTRVPFSAGALRVALEPTTTGFPSTSAYSMNCTADPQTVTGTDGKQHTSQGKWGPWTLVVEPTSSTLAQVLRAHRPNPALMSYESTVSGATTTILAATHRLGTFPWVAACVDGSGNVFEPTVAIATNGDITITGTSAMSGTCKLLGAGDDSVYVAQMSGRTVTVLASAHNLVRPMLAACYDSSGAQYQPGAYTVNLASDDVTIAAATTAPAMSGNCILQ
jgi:hypothetical protein